MFNWLRNIRSINHDSPPFWRQYLAAFDTKLDLRQLIEEGDFVVFDTETTGLNVKKDKILSIGAVRVKNWEIDLSDSFDHLVNQEYQSENQQSITIHGILPVLREESLEEEQAIQAFLDYVGNSILVGHHVAFDIRMVNKSLRRLKLSKLKNKHLDTAYLANRVQGNYNHMQNQRLGLDELCQKYGISPTDRHTAAGDAFLTAILFMKLLYKLKKRGVRNLADLLR